jgi:surface antigen
VTINGEQVQANDHACRQADGSWQVTQKTPGLPDQVYSVPAMSYPYLYYQSYSAYPYLYPFPDLWWYGPPVFVGGTVFFAHGFHHFRDRGGFHDHGSHGGGIHSGGRGMHH